MLFRSPTADGFAWASKANWLHQLVGEDAPQYKNAIALYDQNIARTAIIRVRKETVHVEKWGVSVAKW